MVTITDLVRELISNDPKIYGSDDGTRKLFAKVLAILKKEEQDAVATLTTVERVRRKFLEDNPGFDYRIKDKAKQRAK